MVVFVIALIMYAHSQLACIMQIAGVCAVQNQSYFELNRKQNKYKTVGYTNSQSKYPNTHTCTHTHTKIVCNECPFALKGPSRALL